MLRNRERGPFGAPFQTGFTNRMASRRDCLLTANPGDAPGAPFFFPSSLAVAYVG